MIQRQVIVDGLSIRYCESSSSGLVILLLHGWGDSAVTFARLESKLGVNYRLIAVDLPGFGGSETPRETWGLDNYAQFVASFMQKIEVKPLAILGHSNGGAIAIRGLSSGQLDAQKLILLASAGVRSDYQGKKKVYRWAAKLAKTATAPLPKHTRDKLKKKAYQSIGSDMFVAENLQETFKKVVTDDVQNDAKKINIPTLLVYGSEDTATPPRYGELFSRLIPDAKLEIIDGAGHFVHHDAPVRVEQLVEDFLQ